MAHPLSVAFFLMADGDQEGSNNDHKNPWCVNDPEPEGDEDDNCDVTVTAIGMTAATRIMFGALTNYMSSNHGWDDFGNLARGAAYSRYSNCPSYNGSTEQQAVIDAFAAIGYPTSSSSPIVCK